MKKYLLTENNPPLCMNESNVTGEQSLNTEDQGDRKIYQRILLLHKPNMHPSVHLAYHKIEFLYRLETMLSNKTLYQ